MTLSDDELNSYQEGINVLVGTRKTSIPAAHESSEAIRALNGTAPAIVVKGYKSPFDKMQQRTVKQALTN